MAKTKVLVAETDASTRQALGALLAENGYEVLEAADGASAGEVLEQEGAPRLALLDSNLQGEGGTEICRRMKKRRNDAYFYGILLAEREDRQKIVEGIAAGADDFLTKPVDDFELEVRVRNGKRAILCHEGLNNSEKTIDYQAYHDPLTGLWNRAAIIDTLRRELARVRREKTPVGIAMVALDGLKTINERAGYAAGDDAIRSTARHMTSLMRPYDTVGRYSDEIFLVIVPGCDELSASKAAARLHTGLGAQPLEFIEWGKYTEGQGSALTMTVSIGVASATGEILPESLLYSAESALRQAQSAGGNRLEVASAVVAGPIAKAG